MLRPLFKNLPKSFENIDFELSGESYKTFLTRSKKIVDVFLKNVVWDKIFKWFWMKILKKNFFHRILHIVWNIILRVVFRGHFPVIFESIFSYLCSFFERFFRQFQAFLGGICNVHSCLSCRAV